MEHPPITQQAISALANYCAVRRCILLAYLFGSRARGDSTPASDYDIALLVDRPLPHGEKYRWAYELSRVLGGQKVDLLILNTAPVELQYRVIAEGCRLYERDAAVRVEFEAKVLGRYGDILPMLRQQRRDLLRGVDIADGVQRYREALEQTLRMLAEARGPSQPPD